MVAVHVQDDEARSENFMAPANCTSHHVLLASKLLTMRQMGEDDQLDQHCTREETQVRETEATDPDPDPDTADNRKETGIWQSWQ